MSEYGHLIVFDQGKRIDKRIHKTKLKDAAVKVKQLKSQGVRAHLVWRTDTSIYPPPHQVEEMRNEGQLWCPYCRAWRWYTVPKFTPRAEIGSEAWFMNSYHRQGIRACKWCHMSISDFWVCKANGIFGEVNGRRRRRKRKTR